MKRIYFTDFDGTITKIDTTNAMTRAFAAAGWQEHLLLWEKGELSTTECSRRIFQGFSVSRKDLADFLLAIPIDERFPDFVRYVRSRQEPLYVISDGYDFNIELILQKAGISDLTYYSNQLILRGTGWDIDSPYLAPDCGKCGTCKKNLVRSLKRAGSQTIYIGDGHSDRCGCREADIIFAKGHLLQYCLENNIPCRPFETFADIIVWLKNQDQADC